jgi:hypothetical protein
MMQAVIPRASTRPDGTAAETVTTRLSAEFSTLSRATVERCVFQTWMCAEHLGLPVTGGLVEGLAREHLHAVVKSVPPSRRP